MSAVVFLPVPAFAKVSINLTGTPLLQSPWMHPHLPHGHMETLPFITGEAHVITA